MPLFLIFFIVLFTMRPHHPCLIVRLCTYLSWIIIIKLRMIHGATKTMIAISFYHPFCFASQYVSIVDDEYFFSFLFFISMTRLTNLLQMIEKSDEVKIIGQRPSWGNKSNEILHKGRRRWQDLSDGIDGVKAVRRKRW